MHDIATGLADAIESAQGVALEDYQRSEIELFETGRELRNVVNTPAWEIILNSMRRYADRAVEDLLNLLPGDPAVTTAHAAASALVQQHIYFKQDVERAVEASYKTPEVLLPAVRAIREN